MRTLLLGAGFAFFASSGLAAGLLRWETPDGGLYYGDTPPEGSTFAGEAEKLGTVGDGWVAEAPEEAAAAPAAAPAASPPAEPVDAEPVAVQVPGDAREIESSWKKVHEALAGQPAP
jgi:hypothetical protein